MSGRQRGCCGRRSPLSSWKKLDVPLRPSDRDSVRSRRKNFPAVGRGLSRHRCCWYVIACTRITYIRHRGSGGQVKFTFLFVCLKTSFPLLLSSSSIPSFGPSSFHTSTLPSRPSVNHHLFLLSTDTHTSLSSPSMLYVTAFLPDTFINPAPAAEEQEEVEGWVKGGREDG